MNIFGLYLSPGAFLLHSDALFDGQKSAVFNTTYESSAFVPYNHDIHGIILNSFKKFKKQKLELKIEQNDSSRHLSLSIKVKKVLFQNHFEL